MLSSLVPTPCLGICTTGIGDDVCRGCKRYKHEVIQWNGCTAEQKQAIERRLSELLTTIVKHRIQIVSEDRLVAQLALQPVRLPAHRNIECQLFELIRAGASQIADTTQFGFTINTEFSHLSLAELYEDMDKEFYSLSVAHYQRYFNQYSGV